ncbi:MAG TPA: hypothetical protein VF865_13405, partial [Acidobacteriaceae bacterium]
MRWTAIRSEKDEPMKVLAVLVGLGLCSVAGAAQGVKCDMQGYKAVDGLRAEADGGGVTLVWRGEGHGEGSQELRAR